MARTAEIGGEEMTDERWWINRCDELDAELTRLRALVADLRTALQELYDVQTIAPYTEDVDYDRAVAQAKAALDKE